MDRNEKNEIIWRIRKETGCGLMTIDKALDKFIEALKRMPHTMDVRYELCLEWKPYGTIRIEPQTKQSQETDLY